MEFSIRGGGFLPILGPFPYFFILFLNMVWIIQKCKEIFFLPLGDPPPSSFLPQRDLYIYRYP